MQKGIICSLTNEQAAFKGESCPEYILDGTAKQKVGNELAYKKSSNQYAIVSGGIMIGLGLIWLIAGLMYGMLFFYSIALIIAGAVTLGIGINRRTVTNAKISRHVEDDLV